MSCTERNKMGDKQIEVLKNNFRIFRFHFMWPKRNEPLTAFSYKFNVTLFLLSNCPIVVGSVMDLIFVLLYEEKLPYEEIIDCMVIIFSATGMFYICLTFIWKREEIDRLVKRLGNFERFGVPPQFDLFNKRIERFIAFIYVYCTFGSCYGATYGPIHKSSCEDEKLRDGKCGFVGPVWTPFPKNVTPMYEITVLMQWYCAHNLTSVSLTISSMVASSLEHLILRIKHLKELMEGVFKATKFELRKQRLRNCILYHNDIISLTDNINSCFKMMMFMHLSLTSLILCMTGYKSVTVYSVLDFVHMIGWFLALFLQCYAGQHLIDESSSIAFAMYNSNWYDAEVILQKDVTAIMRRAQDPLSLQAGPFAEISYSVLQAVVKTTYSYLTLLTKT